MKRTATCLGLGMLLLVLGIAAPVRADGPLPGEHDLLQRLFSPCCYRETLDVHASPIADELRIEIHKRLGRGETPDGILADMVSRYGDDVLTKPPRTVTAVALFAGAGFLVTLLIGAALRRGRRASAAPPAAPVILPPSTDEERRIEDRLADELGALD